MVHKLVLQPYALSTCMSSCYVLNISCR